MTHVQAQYRILAIYNELFSGSVEYYYLLSKECPQWAVALGTFCEGR